MPVKPPGFYFCLCPDAALCREQVERLLSELDDGPRYDRHTWWADEGLDASFWEALTLPGLTGKPRLLTVRGAQALPAEVWKKLSAALATPRQGILPVFFLESGWEKGQPKLPAHIAKLRCLEFAGKQKWVWRSPGLDARSLPRYVSENAARLGLRLDAEAQDALCALLAPDAAAVRGMLEQLFLAAQPAPDAGAGEPRCVHADLVRQMTAHTPEVIIFDFIRHLENGDTTAVWHAMLTEGDGGESMLFPLLGLLAREARTLWMLRAGEQVFVPQYAAAAKRALADRLGYTGLSRLFGAVMEAEWTVKSGQRQPLQAFEELVAELTLLFRPSRAG